MPWLIGVDEAGYGPNLGPLVVAATLWHLESPSPTASSPKTKASGSKNPGKPRSSAATNAASADSSWDLYRRLAPIVAPPPHPAMLHVADSKQLYSPQKGIQPLQQIARVTASLLDLAEPAASWLQLAQVLKASQHQPAFHAWPWYTAAANPTSLADDSESATSIDSLCQAVGEHATQNAVRLAGAVVALVEPETFNEACEAYDNKSTLLSTVTLELVRDLVSRAQSQAPLEPILCRCDRHGGRARYRGLLESAFPETWFEPLEENSRLSRYRGTSAPPLDSLLAGLAPPVANAAPVGELEFRFEVGSEQFLETAWASCLAKFFREQAMDAFNDFWSQLVPGLTPTRGYPVDAARFRDAILPAAQRLGISPRTFWRNR